MYELDLADGLCENYIKGTASFFEIIKSVEIECAKSIRNVDLRHFIVATYDDVFEIVAKDYKLKFIKED